MNNRLEKIYHLTNIVNCREILLSGKIRPRDQCGAIFKEGENNLSNPGKFVHFNFCTKSPMLWNLFQGRCWSVDKIYGQEDAVYLEFDIPNFIFGLNLGQANNFIVSDCDITANGYMWKELNGTDNIVLLIDAIANTIDISEINYDANTIDAAEHPKKGAELMVGMEIFLAKCPILSIGVHDATAKGRLLNDRNISQVYGDKISIQPEWYF